MLKDLLVALLVWRFPWVCINLSLRSLTLYTYNLGSCYQIGEFYLFAGKENYFIYVPKKFKKTHMMKSKSVSHPHSYCSFLGVTTVFIFLCFLHGCLIHLQWFIQLIFEQHQGWQPRPPYSRKSTCEFWFLRNFTSSLLWTRSLADNINNRWTYTYFVYVWYTVFFQ